mmetsp:Transcript_72420/g.199717  ORF Transcript_72420/g.199717 Transcript_72420/m.199717 type:complete len:529 (-) Transcript_72420:81-1667(-)
MTLAGEGPGGLELGPSESARLSAMVMEARTTPPAALNAQLAEVLCELGCTIEREPDDMGGAAALLPRDRVLHMTLLAQRAMQGLKQVEQECNVKIMELMHKCRCPTVAAPGMECEAPPLLRRQPSPPTLSPALAPPLAPLPAQRGAAAAGLPPPPAPPPRVAAVTAAVDPNRALWDLERAATEVVIAAGVAERAVATAAHFAPEATVGPTHSAMAALAAAAKAVAVFSAASGASVAAAAGHAPLMPPATVPPSAPAAAPAAQPELPMSAPVAARLPPLPPAAATLLPAPMPLPALQPVGPESPVPAALVEEPSPMAAGQASGHLEEVLQPLRDLLHFHQKALHHEDPACIIIVQQINRLGHRSREVLRQHYSQYGEVACIHIAQSKIRANRYSDRPSRARPGGLGLIVMKRPEAVERILAPGEPQRIAGHEIRVERFQRPVSQVCERAAKAEEAEASGRAAAAAATAAGTAAVTSGAADDENASSSSAGAGVSSTTNENGSNEDKSGNSGRDADVGSSDVSEGPGSSP